MEVNINRSFSKTDYKDMTDEEAIEAFEKGDMFALEHLMMKYKEIVKWKARSYYLIGGDREDVIQEGMIGLYKAVLNFDIKRLCYFRSFADVCITRQIITAIKTATRKKHTPLNSYISLNKPIYEETSNRTLLDVMVGNKINNPEELVISEEYLGNIKKNIEKVLSELELKVLILYLDGMTYEEIARETNRHVKSIDNALQRIKRKLKIVLK